MEVCDFSHSFLRWRIDLDKKSAKTVSHKQNCTLNDIRAPLECRCLYTQAQSGRCTEYALGAACKTERVNVDRDIWLDPNADFHPIGSDEYYLRIKSWDRCDKGVMLYPPSLGVQSERQVGRIADTFDCHFIHVEITKGRILETAEQIFQAVVEYKTLVCHTEFELENADLVQLQYPVKTINVSDRDGFYQVDTGPVLFPDLTIGHEKPLGNLRLAYIAHNCPDWAEFVVNVPTPLTEEISVNHYSKAVRVVTTKNTMIEVG